MNNYTIRVKRFAMIAMLVAMCVSIAGCWSSCNLSQAGFYSYDEGAQAVATRAIIRANVEMTSTLQAISAIATRTTIENETAKSQQPAAIVGGSLRMIGLGTGALIFLVGAAFAIVAWINKRATTIYPNKQGQYPVIVRRGLGWVVFHDPTRNPGPGAVYRVPTLADPLMARMGLMPAQAAYPLPELSEPTIAQIAGQSNAIALTAAAHRWPNVPPITISKGGIPLPTPQISEIDKPELVAPQIPAIEFPTRIPLRYMLNGQPPSLERIALGVTVRDGRQITPVYGSMAQMVHILAAGASGWGKSQFLKMLIYQLATSSDPCCLVLADMERTTFGAFGKSDRLMFPVIDSERDLSAALGELTGELERRKELYGKYPDVDNLSAYNERTDARLLPIIVAIDEATSFLVDGDVSDGLKTLVRRARKFGIWVIAGGQTFSARDVDTATSLQFGTRIQYRAPVKSGQQTLVDSKDAKALECPGRAILVLPGQDAIKVQTPTVTYDEIMQALSGQLGPENTMPEPAEIDQTAQIHNLAADGLTPSQIAEQVFGYKNSRAVERVRSILASDTSQ